MGLPLNPSESAFMGPRKVGFWQVDVGTSAVTFSDVAAALLRIDPSQVGKPISMDDALKHFHDEDREAVLARYAEMQKEGGSTVLEYRVIGEDGEARWIHARCHFAFGEGGGMVGRGIVIDITDIHSWSGMVADPISHRPEPSIHKAVPAPEAESDPLAEAASLAVNLRTVLGRSGHGALRLAADLLLWEINTALAARYTISDKAVPLKAKTTR